MREKEKLTQERDALLINDIKLREEIKAAQDKHDKMEKTAQLKETEIYEVFSNTRVFYKYFHHRSFKFSNTNTILYHNS